MQSSKYQSLTLEELKIALVSNKAKTSYQLSEIDRTKEYIKTFEDCLKQQKDALTNYIIDRVKLKEEKAKLIALQEIDIDPKGTDDDTVSSISVRDNLKKTSKRKNEEELNKELVKKKLCNENIIVKNENKETIKSESGFGGSLSEMDNSDIKSEPDLNSRRKWERSKYINNKINDMVVYNNCLFLCGSDGMLLMINNTETIKLNTECRDNIRQIAIFKFQNTISLIAIALNHIILYIDVLKMQIPEKTLVQVRGNIYQDRNVIYLPVAGEEIKKFNKISGTIENHVSHSHGNVRLFVPCMKNEKKKALISLEDRMLYKTLENDFDILEVIEGVKNVKNLYRFGSLKYVCSSKKNLWILDSTPEVIEHRKFTSCIKFIATNPCYLVIVDDNDQLFVFEDKAEGDISLVHEQEFQSTISALSLFKTKIYLLIQDEIVVLKISK